MMAHFADLHPIAQGVLGWLFLMLVIGGILLATEGGLQRQYRRDVELERHADDAINLTGGRS